MPSPCAAHEQRYRAADDEYDRLCVQAAQLQTVELGLDGREELRPIRPELAAEVEQAKRRLPTARQARQEAALRLAECRRMHGIRAVAFKPRFSSQPPEEV